MDPKSVYENRDSLEVLDVREPSEWKKGRIEGAKHIPMNEIPARLREIGAGPVVTVCRSGARSGKVSEFLRARGIDADNMEGGMLAWDRNGFPYTAPDGRPGEVAEH